jgi:perosamine synthetase
MKKIPFGKPITGEEEEQAVVEVIRSGIMAHGPKIVEFEAGFASFTGAPDSVGVSSCTAGMHLYYFHLGLGPGDEVIVPAMTHTATAHAVELTGAKPIFCDAEPVTGNMNIDLIEGLITPATKALAIVHYLGQPIDMRKVVEIADRHGLKIVEDCALAFGSKIDGIHAGLWGDLGVFSFYPVKHMTTAEGGMVISKDVDLLKALRIKRAFGMDKHVGERKVPGVYDVQGLGFNYRLNEMQAAMGVEQLKRLPGFLKARARNFKRLKAGLTSLVGTQVIGDEEDLGMISSHYCLTLRFFGPLVEKRPDVIEGLKALGVGTSIYYPRPVAEMSYYANKYGYTEGDLPHAAAIAHGSIALPVGPHMDESDVDYVVEQVKKVIEELR